MEVHNFNHEGTKKSETFSLCLCAFVVYVKLPTPRSVRRRSRDSHIGCHHQPHQLLEGDARLPAQLLARFRRVAHQQVYLGRAVEFGVLHHKFLQVQVHKAKGFLDKFLHAVGFTHRHHIIVRGILLQHRPHGPHIVRRVTPVPPGVQIAQTQFFFQMPI